MNTRANTNAYQDVPRQQLIEEMRQRAELMCSGEAMELLCRQRHHFVAETGRLMQVLAAQLDGDTSHI